MFNPKQERFESSAPPNMLGTHQRLKVFQDIDGSRFLLQAPTNELVTLLWGVQFLTERQSEIPLFW